MLVLKSQWSDLESYKGWLLFLFVPPVSYAGRWVCGHLQQSLQNARYLRVEISPYSGHDLLQAVLHFVNTHAGSVDAEAIADYDNEQRSYVAKLNYISGRGGLL